MRILRGWHISDVSVRGHEVHVICSYGSCPEMLMNSVQHGQVLRIDRICSDEEESNGHLKVLKDTLVRMGYDAQLIDRQFRHATAKNCNDLLRTQAQDTTNRISFVIQYFSGVENYATFFAAFNMQGCPKAWYSGETMQTLRQLMNGRHTTIVRQECSLPLKGIQPPIFGACARVDSTSQNILAM
eukprot:g46232.t1